MAGTTGATWDTSELLRGLEEAQANAMAAAEEGVSELGQRVLADARELCPKRSGELAESGVATESRRAGQEIETEVAFTAPYAAAVHEDLTANHANGQAKFLETAMRKDAGRAGAVIAGKMTEAL